MLDGLFNLISSGVNAISQGIQNQTNREFALAQTQAQWERDDTAYQRAVADAVAAGFSPLAVLDGGVAASSSPMAYQGQAPQIDMSGFNQIALAKLQSNENQLQRNFDEQMQIKEFNHQLDVLDRQYQHDFDLANDAAEKESIRQERDCVNALRIQAQIQKDNLDSIRTKDLLEDNQKVLDTYRQYGLTNFTFFNIDDPDEKAEYDKAIIAWNSNVNNVIYLQGDDPRQSSLTGFPTHGYFNRPNNFSGSESFSASGGVTALGSASESDSSSQSRDVSWSLQMQLVQLNMTYSCPIAVSGGRYQSRGNR